MWRCRRLSVPVLTGALAALAVAAPAAAHDGPHLWDAVPLWQLVAVALVIAAAVVLRAWLRRRRAQSGASHHEE